MMPSVKEIDALLPQTQCGECGFNGCLPYAEALAQGAVSIDKCPPGGLDTLKALGTLLHIDPTTYAQNEAFSPRLPSAAKIREAECIGCTKCIKACPVDAIIGSAKLMHAVIHHECTGCGLCVPACPVDCIDMVTLPEPAYDPHVARQHFHEKKSRILRDEHQKQVAYREQRKLAQQSDQSHEIKAKQAYIQEALARVRAKK